MQRVLIIGKVWPEPGSSAAGSRMMQLINVFREQNWAIDFACAAGESEYMPDLESIGIQLFNIVVNDAGFDDLLKDRKPDVVLFDRFITEEQFGWRVSQHTPYALQILDTIDLHCLRQGRHLALKESREFELTDLLKHETAKREIASIYRCDLSLLVSMVEMEILEGTFKIDTKLLVYIPFMFERMEQDKISLLKPFEEREHFISIGNFLHEPNWDSVQYLKKDIWPLIRKKLPNAEVHIYGAYPSQKVFELDDPKTGFLIRGRALDAMEVMTNAKICLAPLRFGAGIKGKLSDAMLCGTPSVTTSVGAESMSEDLPWNGKIADSPTDISDAAVILYQSEKEWKISQGNGINIINQVFNKTKFSNILIKRIQELLANLKEHRLQNFTGNMLRHHTAASTKYMSMWIEAKNKQG